MDKVWICQKFCAVSVDDCSFLISGIMDDKKKICGNCLLCLHTYLGCECSLIDNPVDYKQEACIDYISDED